jgi:hypothetical protein
MFETSEPADHTVSRASASRGAPAPMLEQAPPGRAGCGPRPVPHPLSGFQPLGRRAGPDHIDPIQEFLLLDRIDLASPRQVTVTHCETEMLGHLVMVDYLARSHAALGRRLARTRRPRHAHSQRLQTGGWLRQDRAVPRKDVSGASQPREEVVVQFDAETAEWVISDPGGVELCRRSRTNSMRRVSGDCPSNGLTVLCIGNIK